MHGDRFPHWRTIYRERFPWAKRRKTKELDEDVKWKTALDIDWDEEEERDEQAGDV